MRAQKKTPQAETCGVFQHLQSVALVENFENILEGIVLLRLGLGTHRLRSFDSGMIRSLGACRGSLGRGCAGLARVQLSLGLKVVAVVPAVIPSSTAH